MSSNLTRRVIVAAIVIPIVLVGVYLGGWFLAAGLALFGGLGAREVYRLAERGGVRPLTGVGYVGAVAAPLATYAALPAGGGLGAGTLWFGVALWVMATMVTAMATRAVGDRPLAALGITCFGAMYAGWLPSFLMTIRHGAALPSAWSATWLVFLPLVLTWVGDSLAMAGGALIGGRKLAPVLSPNKTWAGALSGSGGALILAPLYGMFVLEPLGVSIGLWQLAGFGLAVSIVGQAGDVAESLLKREVGLKDSGGFFPGHGGVLDRLDSLYWAIPTAALLLHVLEVV